MSWLLLVTWLVLIIGHSLAFDDTEVNSILWKSFHLTPGYAEQTLWHTNICIQLKSSPLNSWLRRDLASLYLRGGDQESRDIIFSHHLIRSSGNCYIFEYKLPVVIFTGRYTFQLEIQLPDGQTFLHSSPDLFVPPSEKQLREARGLLFNSDDNSYIDVSSLSVVGGLKTIYEPEELNMAVTLNVDPAYVGHMRSLAGVHLWE